MNVKALSDITKIVVETDEKQPKTIAVITADDIDSAEGFRVRITPKYDCVKRTESKKAPNKELLDTLNTNLSFSFSENGLVIQSDERSIKVESSSVELIEKR